MAFLLGVVVTQPIYSSVSDVMGRTLPLYSSILLFAVGSALFAATDDMNVLVAGRLLQGLGVGGLDVLQVIILSDMTSLRERAFWLGLESIPVAAGSIAGPILGALFAQHVSWRWIGWVNLPVIGTALALAVVFLRLRSLPMSRLARLRRLDWVGMALFTTGVTCVTLPLTWADLLYGWASWRTLVPLLSGVGLLIVFAVLEARPGLDEPMLPYRILTGTNALTARVTLLCSTVHGLVLYTLTLYIPLFFEAVYNESPLGAAVTFLPTMISTVVFTAVTPAGIQWTRRYRLIFIFAWLFATVSMGLWCTVGPATSHADLIGYQIMLGVGAGAGFSFPLPMQASVPDVNDTGLASGMIITMRLTGGLVGLTVASALFSGVFRGNVEVLGSSLPGVLREKLQGASNVIDLILELNSLDLAAEVMTGLVEAYRNAFRAIWIAMTCFSALGLLLSLLIKDLSLERDALGRQAFVSETQPLGRQAIEAPASNPNEVEMASVSGRL